VSGKTPVPPPNSATKTQREIFQRNRKRWEEYFTDLNLQREKLEQQIAAGSAEFQELRGQLTVATIQQLLPPGTRR